jgi:hypothetical protein
MPEYDQPQRGRSSGTKLVTTALGGGDFEFDFTSGGDFALADGGDSAFMDSRNFAFTGAGDCAFLDAVAAAVREAGLAFFGCCSGVFRVLIGFCVLSGIRPVGYKATSPEFRT